MSDLNLNMNIEDYSIDELLQVLNLYDNPSLHQINSAAALSIDRVKSSIINYDKHLVLFLENTRDRLIDEFSTDYFNKKNDIDNENKEIGKWYKNEYLEAPDPNQALKVTDRVQQVGVFDDKTHFPMKRNILGINQSVQLPVTQDSLNPTLRNLNTRIVNIDSQFRPNILPFNPSDPNASTSSTNYTFELTETLTNVLSILLYSVQIPNTWYRFSAEQGNICFNLDISGILYSFNLPPGNYDPSGILMQLDDSNNWTSPASKPTQLSWSYNVFNSKFSFILTGSNPVTFYFYDISGGSDCGGCFPSSLLNQNLGWSLGFRPNSVTIKTYTSFIKTYTPGSYTLDAVSDLYGPKYFSIILDDFNQNRQNKGLINIGVPEDTHISLPSYYSGNIKLDCSGNLVNLDKNKGKKFTQSQLYHMNQVLQNKNSVRQRNYGKNSSEVLAILPIDMNSNIRQQPYTTFGANILLNERRYYGPVDITKMKVRLVDDKGNTVNLNGADWCMSIIVNELYQY